MSAHPPGHPPVNPPSPTGPGRSHTPGSSDAAHSPSVGPGFDLPRLRFGDLVRVLEALLTETLTKLALPVDRATYPAGRWGDIADADLELVEHRILQALHVLGNTAVLSKLDAPARPDPGH